MKRSIVRMSGEGHSPVAEWDTETVTKERLAEIEKDYNTLIAQGYTPADVTDGKDEIVTGRAFNPAADTLMIPRMRGGRD